jgi:uncharacterized metal-binding protein YceD (DUF177 family)
VIIQIRNILNVEQYFLEELINEIELPKDMSLKDNLEMSLMITHGDNKEVYVKGKLFSKVTLKCVFCLKEFDENYSIDFDDIYLPDKLFKVPLSDPEKTIDTFFYCNNQININEIARDILLAEISPYPTCSKCSKLK